MNTTITAPAHIASRASIIWSDLEEWNDALALSDVDYYAVWGLAFAILNTPNREDAYERWLDTLESVWADVKARNS